MARWNLTGQSTSAAGPGVNEDGSGVVGNLAWIIDGATAVDPPVLAHDSDAAWLVRRVDASLARVSTPFEGSLTDLVSALIDEIRSDLRARSYPSDRLPPVCSIAICRLADRGVDLALVGDATVAWCIGGVWGVVDDDRFARIEAAAARETKDHQSVLDGMKHRRAQYRSGASGLWVLADNPAAADAARVERLPRVDAVVLCTDGFRRLQDCYSMNWTNVLAAARNGMLSDLIERARLAESVRPQSEHLKRRDDATVLAVEPAWSS